MSTVEQRLADAGHPLPSAPSPVASYVPVLRTGNLVITSGQLPTVGKEVMFTGKLGRELHEEQGQHAARLCALNALAQLKAAIGSLDYVTRIVRVEGYVQSADGFTKQSQVLNGASELLVEAFGERGKHTRIAVGVAELPMDAAVELAIWAEVPA
jgi:enamine deaminase RidA (YjgF/YER057c/UK114 family)|uniref:RidA family protein n=1 Tax=Schlesneria paludicola TaxID=360056 RepID=A0A7C4LJQ2_9PLAN